MSGGCAAGCWDEAPAEGTVSGAPGADRLRFAPAPLPPLTRRLTADERRELRSALVARSSRLADVMAEPFPRPEGIEQWKATVDALLAMVDEMRVEVPR